MVVKNSVSNYFGNWMIVLVMAYLSVFQIWIFRSLLLTVKKVFAICSITSCATMMNALSPFLEVNVSRSGWYPEAWSHNHLESQDIMLESQDMHICRRIFLVVTCVFFYLFV